MFQEFFEHNKKLWDKRVQPHLQSALYDMEAFLAGESSLTEIERDELCDVQGKSLLHLQCHFGQDSLSLARLGADVTGVDFAPAAIEQARSISDQINVPARFICSNVYDLSDHLDEQFDIVFSTYGAIPWLPDLTQWAEIVGHFLKPGGIFYLAEFHPTLYLFNQENYKVEYSYFNERDPYAENVVGSYADTTTDTPGKEFFWSHSIGEIIGPLLKQGLTLLQLNEFDFSPYHVFPNMIEREPGRFVWGTRFGVRLPHVISITMKQMS